MKINSTPSHFGKQHAGQVLNWLPSDTEENYNNHCQRPEYREYVKSKGWDKPDAITYRINSLGYRGDEFDFEKPCLLALGCSFSIGTGLPESDVWPWRLGKALNLPVVNLSWGGYSADTCFRLAEYFLPRLNIQLCVMVTPPADRIEMLIDPTEFEVFMSQSNSRWFDSSDIYLKHWITYEENSRLNNLKNTLALEMLCSKHQIPCQIYSAFEFFARSREEVEYARDYMHAGPLGHRQATEKILNDIT